MRGDEKEVGVLKISIIDKSMTKITSGAYEEMRKRNPDIHRSTAKRPILDPLISIFEANVGVPLKNSEIATKIYGDDSNYNSIFHTHLNVKRLIKMGYPIEITNIDGKREYAFKGRFVI